MNHKSSLSLILGSLLALIFIAMANSCTKKPSPLEVALVDAGKNKSELESVLEHYKTDSLKFLAAVFLIENMPYHSGIIYSDTTKLYSYYYAICSLQKDPRYICDSIRSADGPFNKYRHHPFYDIKEISASFLIKHIDAAFKAWESQPWRDKISFDVFCHHILPYRLRDEPLALWNQSLYEKYNPLLDSLRQTSDSANILKAATIILKHLHNQPIYFTHAIPQEVNIGVKNENWKIGDCKEFTDILSWILRSLAIPCGCDKMIVRGDNNVPHYWNYIIDNDGTCWYGSIGDSDAKFKRPETYWNPKGKVWRERFALNQDLLLKLNTKTELKKIHPTFRYPLMEDVTPLYANPKCLTFRISPNKLYRIPDHDEIIYLCLSYKNQWTPIDCLLYDGDHVIVSDVEGDVVFRLALYNQKELNFISSPFFIDRRTGNIRWYDPSILNETIVLDHKFNLRTEPFGERMVGGIFEGSNTVDFSIADTLAIIKRFPTRLLNRIKNSKLSNYYRYVRYKGPKGSHCDIAELCFVDVFGNIIKGNVIGDGGPIDAIYRVFDGNTDTSFHAENNDYAWVGIDFGCKRQLTTIIYTPRNRKNYIQPGDTYELFYCDDEWISAGKIKAVSDSLVFTVPKNALLYLRNLTEGDQERIFEYRNNDQIWH